MKGRKPKDVGLKILAGNPGKRPLSTASTTSDEAFVKGSLEKPDHLDEYESKEWDRITTALAPILSPGDAGTVEAACSAYSDYRKAKKQLEYLGDTIYETVGKSGGTMERERMAQKQKVQARQDWVRCLSLLGATPVDHTRVKKLPDDIQTELPGISRLLG